MQQQEMQQLTTNRKSEQNIQVVDLSNDALELVGSGASFFRRKCVRYDLFA